MDEAEIKAFCTITRLRNILGELVIEYNADKIMIFEIIDEHLTDIIEKVGNPDVDASPSSPKSKGSQGSEGER